MQCKMTICYHIMESQFFEKHSDLIAFLKNVDIKPKITILALEQSLSGNRQQQLKKCILKSALITYFIT